MYNFYKLSNGLKIVTENIDYVNSVSVGLWIENGSRNENISNNGISHFIEHMLFKGTGKRSSKEVAECIEDVGGQLNAFTGKEATCFYIKILDTHLELALDVLSDMLFNSKFSEEDIEREKGVISEEINMSEDSPEDVLIDLHSAAIWGQDSISLPILGTLKSIKTFNRKQLLDYVGDYYIPQNSVISIAGKFDEDNFNSLIQKYFGAWENRNDKVTVYSSPKINNSIMVKRKKIEQLHLSLGIEGVPLGDDDVYPLLLLNNILGGGSSSILFQKIREEMALCYSIYSYISVFNNTGIVSVYTSLTPNCAIDAVNVIKQEINEFVNKGIDEKKLLKAKEQFKGSYVLGLESTSSRMFTNGKSALFLNRIDIPKDIIEKINLVDMDKIKNVMNKTFGKGIMNAAFVGDNVDFEGLKTVTEKDVIGFKIKDSDKILV